MTRLDNSSALPRRSSLLPFVVTLAGLYFAREILVPLILAALFAFLLTPAVRYLETLKLPRILAVLLMVALSFVLIGGPGWIAINQLIDVLNQLPDYRANIHKKFDSLRGPSGGGLAKARESVKELSKELAGGPVDPAQSLQGERSKGPGALPLSPSVERPVPVQLVEPASTPLQSLRNLLGPLLGPIGTSGIVLVFAIVILLKREDLRNRFLRLIGQSQLHLATQALDDAAQRVSRYLRLQLIVNVSFGIIIGTGLHFIGLPNALLWGLLSGVLRFIPYVGALIGASMPAILALAIFDTWLQPLLCLSLFLVAEPLVAYVIEPSLYGTHTGISPLAILVAAAFWTTLWGPVGLVLSTPLTVCLVVIGRHVPQLEFLHVILGDEQVLSPAAQLYQRLLALDQREARSLIETVLKGQSLVELYDEVLIPALSMAEEDRHKGTLDEARELFLLQTLEEFVAELGDASTESPTKPAEVDHSDSAGTLAPVAPILTRRIFCVPASDKADEITAAMLAQVLEVVGYPTVSFPVVGASPALFERLSLQEGDVVCISALPPFALINARSVSRQLRSSFPDLRIVLGLWSFSGGGERADERLGKAFAVEVVTTIAQAIECVGTPPTLRPVREDAA